MNMMKLYVFACENIWVFMKIPQSIFLGYSLVIIRY